MITLESGLSKKKSEEKKSEVKLSFFVTEKRVKLVAANSANKKGDPPSHSANSASTGERHDDGITESHLGGYKGRRRKRRVREEGGRLHMEG